MDVILFLFKISTKVTIALVGFAAAGITFLLNRLSGTISKRAQQPPVRQEQAPPDLQPVRHAPQTMTTEHPSAIHIHVHLEQQAQAQPMPAPALASAPSHSILSRPDHRIYITAGSHLMMEHPDSERLLDKLDEMLYYGAHRNGEPFTFNPPLDDSRAGGPAAFQLPPVAALDDGDFFSDEAHQLPAPDGALWLRKAGHEAQRLTANSPS